MRNHGRGSSPVSFVPWLRWRNSWLPSPTQFDVDLGFSWLILGVKSTEKSTRSYLCWEEKWFILSHFSPFACHSSSSFVKVKQIVAQKPWALPSLPSHTTSEFDTSSFGLALDFLLPFSNETDRFSSLHNVGSKLERFAWTSQKVLDVRSSRWNLSALFAACLSKWVVDLLTRITVQSRALSARLFKFDL